MFAKANYLFHVRPLHFLAKMDRISASLGFQPTKKGRKKSWFIYLKEYYKRENSEAGFSANKKLFGWEIAQRREDRIDSALFCTDLWHNIFNFDR